MNCNVNDGIASTKKMHSIGDDFEKKPNSTNSNSPIDSVTSIDESIFDGGDQKLGNIQQQPSFYSSHHNFSDDKSSGASSLFSSGM
jgi:hypothetical protein